MDAEFIRTLYDYHYWARDRVLVAAQGLSEEDYARPNGFNYGSLRAILTHAASGEAVFLARWKGEELPPFVTEADLPTLQALEENWRQSEAKMRAFLATLTDKDLDREIVSTTRAGDEYRRSLALDMTNVVNHGTQHRSEAAEALTMIGRSPGNLDLGVYIIQRNAAKAPNFG